jgi:hypothetical protein
MRNSLLSTSRRAHIEHLCNRLAARNAPPKGTEDFAESQGMGLVMVTGGKELVLPA